MTDSQTTDMRGWPSEEVSDAVADNAEAGFSDVPMDDDGMPTTDALRTALKAVMDPEIGINIVDLGLVYRCDEIPLDDGRRRIEIDMTMTAPGCGMGDVIARDAEAAVQRVAGVDEVDVTIVWDPPWTRCRISEAARLELGLL